MMKFNIRLEHINENIITLCFWSDSKEKLLLKNILAYNNNDSYTYPIAVVSVNIDHDYVYKTLDFNCKNHCCFETLSFVAEDLQNKNNYAISIELNSGNVNIKTRHRIPL